MGQPESKNKAKFTSQQFEGVTVWKAADIGVDERKGVIRIGLMRIFFFKNLKIDGAVIAAES